MLCLEKIPKIYLQVFFYFSFHQIEDLRCSNCVSHGTKHASLQIEPWSPPYCIILIFYCSGVYYDVPLIIVSGLEMSLISGDVRSLNWLPIKDRLKLNDATMVLSALKILLQTTLQMSLSCVLVFMTGKLDQLVPWIYPFAVCQLVRDLLLIEERNCVTH